MRLKEVIYQKAIAIRYKSIAINIYRVMALGLMIILTACSQVSHNVHLRYGNPSHANTQLDNYLIERSQYALSYNCQAGIPNWVSWQLDRNWLGKAERSNDFRPDPDLPENCYAAKPFDYRGSGYDRGHLVPSGDRTRNQEDNSATFIMSNIIPQVPANNREVWREFEEYCRNLVFQGKELYIVAGGNEVADKISKQRIAVQKHNWKVVLISDRFSEAITVDNAQTIAVWIPNSREVINTNWRDYIVSVNEVERKTGYDFFARLPTSIQKQIER